MEENSGQLQDRLRKYVLDVRYTSLYNYDKKENTKIKMPRNAIRRNEYLVFMPCVVAIETSLKGVLWHKFDFLF